VLWYNYLNNSFAWTRYDDQYVWQPFWVRPKYDDDAGIILISFQLWEQPMVMGMYAESTERTRPDTTQGHYQNDGILPPQTYVGLKTENTTPQK